MKKITLLLMAMVGFAFSANAQLAFNQNPMNNTDQQLVAGIRVDTIQVIQPDGVIITSPAYDVDFTWFWTPSKPSSSTWTPDATGTTAGVRNTGAPTVVNSFFQWTGAGSAYTAAAPAGEYLFAPQCASTRRGFAMRVKSKDGTIQNMRPNASAYTRNQSGYFSLGDGMLAGGDPIWFNTLADMKAYVTSGKYVLSDRSYQKDSLDTSKTPPALRTDYGALNDQLHTVATADYPNGFNTADPAMAVVINKNGGGASGDGALGIYPGIFKDIDLRFSFRSDRHQLTRDIEFDILTLDPGNTGKTSTWDVIASLTYNNVDAANPARDNTDSLQLGETGSIVGGYVFNDPVTSQPTQVGRRWKIATYTTGSGTLHIDVNKATGLKPQDLFNKTIVIALQTKGTDGDTDNPSGTFDPIVAIDNIVWGGYSNVQLDATQWAASAEPLLPVRDVVSNPTGTVWDFTSWSAATLSNMAADPTNWSAASATRYSNLLAIPAGTPITANGVEVAELKGLTFGALAADRIRIDYGTDAEASRVILNASLNFIVPDCKAGDQIQITFKTNSGGAARGVDIVSNATVVGDNTQSTDVSVTNTYTATADGPVTFKTSNGLQIFKITVNGGGTGIPSIINNDTKEVVKIEYFDLLGRKVPANTQGIVIQKLYYKDGTTGSKKVFVRY